MRFKTLTIVCNACHHSGTSVRFAWISVHLSRQSVVKWPNWKSYWVSLWQRVLASAYSHWRSKCTWVACSAGYGSWISWLIPQTDTKIGAQPKSPAPGRLRGGSSCCGERSGNVNRRRNRSARAARDLRHSRGASCVGSWTGDAVLVDCRLRLRSVSVGRCGSAELLPVGKALECPTQDSNHARWTTRVIWIESRFDQRGWSGGGLPRRCLHRDIWMNFYPSACFHSGNYRAECRKLNGRTSGIKVILSSDFIQIHFSDR